jgi:hypothetical protein
MRHLDENSKEVLDFRYFKITANEQTKGKEIVLQLRFDSQKEYRDWGRVLLEATMSEQEWARHKKEEQLKRKQIVEDEGEVLVQRRRRTE